MKAYRAVYKKSFMNELVKSEWDNVKYFSDLKDAVKWMEELGMTCYYDGIAIQDFQASEMQFSSPFQADPYASLTLGDGDRFCYLGTIAQVEIN